MKRILTITAAALLGSSMLVSNGLAQSVNAGAGANVGVDAEVGVDVGGTGVGADADADVGADVGIGTGSGNGTGVDAGADVGVDADVNVGADTDVGSTVSGEIDSQVDATVTSAISVTDEDREFFGRIGSRADGFFTDDTRTELRSVAELQAQFATMTPGDQQALRDECALIMADGVEGTAAANFCLVIDTI